MCGHEVREHVLMPMEDENGAVRECVMCMRVMSIDHGSYYYCRCRRLDTAERRDKLNKERDGGGI